MKDYHTILKRPLLTEKSNLIKEELNQIIFEVDKRANKIEIKEAVEKLFKVNVIKVRTVNLRGKLKRLGKSQGRKPNWKKAIVSLKEGDQVDFFEGV
jgi:large subunit ribosomal protein L23